MRYKRKDFYKLGGDIYLQKGKPKYNTVEEAELAPSWETKKNRYTIDREYTHVDRTMVARILVARVGEVWNTVHSDFCRMFNKKNWIHQELRSCLASGDFGIVNQDVYIEHNKVYNSRGKELYQDTFYV